MTEAQLFPKAKLF